MINIKDFQSNISKIDKKPHKDFEYLLLIFIMSATSLFKKLIIVKTMAELLLIQMIKKK